MRMSELHRDKSRCSVNGLVCCFAQEYQPLSSPDRLWALPVPAASPRQVPNPMVSLMFRLLLIGAAMALEYALRMQCDLQRC